MITKSTTLLVAALLGLGVTANAVAVTVYTEYTDRAAFEAALATSTIEDFESYPLIGNPDPIFPDDFGRASLTLDDFSLTATPPAIKIWGPEHSGSHNTTVGGFNFLYLDTDIFLQGSTTDFLLNSPVNAFGFDYTGVFGPDTEVTLSIFTVTVDSETFILSPNNLEDDQLFWGVIGSTNFDTTTLFTSLDSGYGVDDVTFGFAVPLPPALWLFSSGLLALAGGSMKRRIRS